jgi:hypothetical protein
LRTEFITVLVEDHAEGLAALDAERPLGPRQRRNPMKPVFALAGVLSLLVAGCATTQRMTVNENPAVCGFLGEAACQDLEKGGKDQASLRWANPTAPLTQYNKVIVDVVGFYGSDIKKVPPKEQEALTALFQKSLTDAMATKYQVVDQAGPGVARVQAAILDAEAATPGLRTISMVIPQARLLGTGYYAVAGKYPFVGGGEAALKVTDSVTGELLGAGADRRVGGGSIQTAAQWQWGDAEYAIKKWSELAVNGMYAYTSGQRKP